jgi:predicted glycosyltransferase
LVRLWIDALTPKQALFSKALIEGAPTSFQCTITTRDYSELNKFISTLGIDYITIGKHGGGTLIEKLRASVDRQKDLIPFVKKSDFDLSLSYISPEAARVSFGIGLKHFICSDSPHASAPSRLAVPLCSSIFTPFPIPKFRWTQYGLKKQQVLKYRALDPWVWLQRSNFRASKKVHEKVLIRLEEWFASYFQQGKGISSILSKLIDGIKKQGDFEITLLPRYDEQREWAKREFGSKCAVPESTIDGAQEISQTDLLIGGGGTMTQEAALLGVPNIWYFPSAKVDVFINYYFPRRLSIEASNNSALLRETFRLLKNIDVQKNAFMERAQRETSSFQDPVEFIFKRLIESGKKV